MVSCFNCLQIYSHCRTTLQLTISNAIMVNPWVSVTKCHQMSILVVPFIASLSIVVTSSSSHFIRKSLLLKMSTIINLHLHLMTHWIHLKVQHFKLIQMAYIGSHIEHLANFIRLIQLFSKLVNLKLNAINFISFSLHRH